MRFRPCIDIHNGQVKQIVGGTLNDAGDQAKENFVAGHGAAYYAEQYRRDGLAGGHVIILNSTSSEYYGASRDQALAALKAYPGGMQAGGGITADSAAGYIEAGASHVIVTSYAFQKGVIRWDHLKSLARAVGRRRVVLDLSCRAGKDGDYYIVTDRWQTFTDVRLDPQTMAELEGYCDEFLIHGVDVEGKSSGVEERLIRILSRYQGRPVTYAGGIGKTEDLERFEKISSGRLDFTIGTGLDLFGGGIPYETVRRFR